MPVPDKLASTRLVAVPGALTALLFVGAVAFGATTLRPAAPTADATGASPAESTAPEAAHTPEPAVALVVDGRFSDPKPTAEPAKPTSTPEAKPSADEEAEPSKPEADPTTKPAPAPVKPAPTAKPKPVVGPSVALVLEGWPKDGKVKLAWKPYTGEGFEYYKVVRSSDATVTWPAGAGDTVIGVIGDANASWWADKPACGVASSYRVFAVRSGDGGYVTLGASNVVTVTPPCAPQPTPHEVKPIGLGAEVKPGEGIRLSWDACGADGFVAYKVVRSLTNPDPRYPLGDATELIAAIGDPSEVTFLDADVAPGETWTYRVVALGHGSDGTIVLCQSVAVAATAQ